MSPVAGAPSGRVIILMGVTGAGKSTIGQLLARSLGWTFLDADDLHPPRNRHKMARGIPLTDEDRQPWLNAVRRCMVRTLADGGEAVIACSLLKQSYREIVLVDRSRVQLVYLRGTPALIAKRLEARRGHFMRPELLPSQFDTLEEPRDAITVDISGSPSAIVQSIRAQLSRSR
jgi:gluconokinase